MGSYKNTYNERNPNITKHLNLEVSQIYLNINNIEGGSS